MNEVEIFCKSVNDTVIKHFNNFEINIYDVNELKVDDIKFYDISAYISVTGAIHGAFIFSVEKQLAATLVPKFIYDELSEAEIPEYAGDVIAEMTNMISANSLNNREEEDIFLGTPLIILGSSANIKNISNGSIAKNYSTPYGQFRCIFIPVEKGSEIKLVVS